MKFEVAEKDEVSGLANCIATEIVNEILENALDIATMRNVPGKSLLTRRQINSLILLLPSPQDWNVIR